MAKAPLFILLFLIVSPFLCDIWVSKTSCNDDGDGSKQTPLCTMQKALQVIEDGATIHVAGGDYDESLEIPEKKVTIKGLGGADPRFISAYLAEGVRTVALTFDQVAFTSRNTLLKLEDADIIELNIFNSVFRLDESSNSPAFITIDASNQEKGVVNITNCVFTQATPAKWTIKSSDPNELTVVMHNNRIEVDELNVVVENFGLEKNNITSKRVSVSSIVTELEKNTFRSTHLIIEGYSSFNMTNNTLTKSLLEVQSECKSPRLIEDESDDLSLTADECKNYFGAYSNSFSETNLVFDEELSEAEEERNITMRHNVLLQQSNRSDRSSFISNLKNHTVDAHNNYFSSLYGPYICSNPGGRGVIVSLGIDYSFFCLRSSCDEYVDYPQLHNATIHLPCRFYTRGTVATITIFSIIYVLLALVGAFVLWKFFAPPQDSTKPDAYRYRLKFLSLFVGIYGLLSVWAPIAAKGVNNGCQTRVPTISCVFTIADSHISSILILLWFFIIFTNIALVAISSTPQLRYKSIHYIFFFSKIVSTVGCIFFAIEIVAFVVDYLSSNIMVISILTLALCALGELGILFIVLKLRSEVKPVQLIMDRNEEGQSPLISGEDDQSDSVADGEFTFYLSEYKSMAMKNLIAEAINLGLIFPFVIWFTVFYKVIGILSIINLLVLGFKSGYKIYSLRGSKILRAFPDYFNAIEIFSAVTSGGLLVAYASILFIYLNANPSVYFVFILTAIYGVNFALSFDKLNTIRNKYRSLEIEDRQNQQQQAYYNQQQSQYNPQSQYNQETEQQYGSYGATYQEGDTTLYVPEQSGERKE